MSKEREYPISGRDFIRHLTTLGIVPADTRRVIIDARFDGLLIMHIEELGTNALLQLEAPALKDAEVYLVSEGREEPA